jgi:hypothetical protein
MASNTDVEIGQVRICQDGNGMYEIIGINNGRYDINWFNPTIKNILTSCVYYAICNDELVPAAKAELYKAVYG